MMMLTANFPEKETTSVLNHIIKIICNSVETILEMGMKITNRSTALFVQVGENPLNGRARHLTK